MPKIIPFKAHRYNEKTISSFDDVLSPPYDVISAKEQAALYKKSPYNFVRIDLRKKDKNKKDSYFFSWIKFFKIHILNS